MSIFCHLYNNLDKITRNELYMISVRSHRFLSLDFPYCSLPAITAQQSWTPDFIVRRIVRLKLLMSKGTLPCDLVEPLNRFSPAQTGAYPIFAYPQYRYNNEGVICCIAKTPKWINPRYYCGFVVPPHIPNSSQLRAFTDQASPEQNQPLHLQNTPHLMVSTSPVASGSWSAAQAQHFPPVSTYTTTGPDWTGQGPFWNTTHLSDVSQLLQRAA